MVLHFLTPLRSLAYWHKVTFKLSTLWVLLATPAIISPIRPIFRTGEATLEYSGVFRQSLQKIEPTVCRKFFLVRRGEDTGLGAIGFRLQQY